MNNFLYFFFSAILLEILFSSLTQKKRSFSASRKILFQKNCACLSIKCISNFFVHYTVLTMMYHLLRSSINISSRILFDFVLACLYCRNWSAAVLSSVVWKEASVLVRGLLYKRTQVVWLSWSSFFLFLLFCFRYSDHIIKVSTHVIVVVIVVGL